jgi:Flp pilus assembly protein TadG
MKRVLNKGIPSSNEHGAVIVELALVLPLLALLLLGIIDLGLVTREHQVLQNAAREGARFSALPQNNFDNTTDLNVRVSMANAIRDRVITYLSQENITLTATACTADGAEAKRYNCGDITIRQQSPITTTIGGVTYTDYGSAVSVTYSRSLLIPGTGSLPFTSVNLTGNSVFRNLY